MHLCDQTFDRCFCRHLDSSCQTFQSARKLTFASHSHNPFACCSVTGPEVGKRTCLKHHYLHSSWLHLPEPPPTCLMLLRFMWLYRRRPIQWARPCVGLLLYWQLRVWYCSRLPVRLGPVYLKSVISESLKRLGQFREDKWWIGRTADVGTQTLQDDGVDWGPIPLHTVVGVPPWLTLLPAAAATDGRDHPLCSPLTEVSTERGHPHEPLYYSHQNKW